MRNIVAWDVETTGLSPQHDHIIQLAMIKFDSEFNILDKLNYIIKPIGEFIIDERATAVHGYTKEYILENGVYLSSVSDQILNFVKDCDYLTYNGNTFDIQFIINDLKSIGVEFPMENKIFYDSYAIECRLNPRNLSGIYKKYTGKDLIGAHDAFADVGATIEIFKNQLKNIDEDISTWPENNLLSPEGSIRNAATPGNPALIVFTKGKYKDTDIKEVVIKDKSYVLWWWQNVATDISKKIVEKYIKNQLNI